MEIRDIHAEPVNRVNEPRPQHEQAALRTLNPDQIESARRPAVYKGENPKDEDRDSRDKDAQDKDKPDARTLLKAAEEARRLLESKELELRFSVHEESQQIQVEIVDKSRSKVLKKIPSDDLIELTENLKREAAGHERGIKPGKLVHKEL